MDLVERAPPVDEKADWDQKTKEYTQWQSHLRFVHALVALCQFDDGCVGRLCDKAYAEEVSDTNSQVCEASDLRLPVVCLQEYGGERRKK